MLLLALAYILFSLFERIFDDFDSRLGLLAFIIVGAVIAKEKGFFDKGLEKVIELISRQKQQ